MKVAYVLILICMALFFVVGSMPDPEEAMSSFAFSGKNVYEGKIWTFMTSLFLHGNIVHLVVNMMALFFFGRALESRVNKKKFLVIFFLSGIGGNMISLLIYPAGTSLIGASGAIFGVMGAAMLIKPFEFVVYPYIIPVPIALVGILYTVYTVMAFLAGGDGQIAYAAHLGGLSIGLLFGFREESNKKGLLFVFLLLGVLLVIPFIWDYLQALNYVKILTIG